MESTGNYSYRRMLVLFLFGVDLIKESLFLPFYRGKGQKETGIPTELRRVLSVSFYSTWPY